MKNTNAVMGTMEHHINVFRPQQHYDHHNSNDILLGNLNPAASALLSAWAPTSKGVYRLNSPEVGDQLMSYQFYNLPTTKININLHIQEDTSWKSWYRKQLIELKWLAPGTHDIFPVKQTQVYYIFSLHMVTLTVLRQDTHHHTANNQIIEFKISYTTYKNPTKGTICHTTYKKTYNNCCSIVLGQNA